MGSGASSPKGSSRDGRRRRRNYSDSEESDFDDDRRNRRDKYSRRHKDDKDEKSGRSSHRHHHSKSGRHGKDDSEDEEEQMSQLKHFIKGKVKKYPVVVFVKTDDKYCDKTIKILESYRDLKSVEVVNVEKEKRIPDAKQCRKYMYEKTGEKHLPQIFIGGHHIGGYDQLEKLDKKDKLYDLLGEAGALDD